VSNAIIVSLITSLDTLNFLANLVEIEIMKYALIFFFKHWKK